MNAIYFLFAKNENKKATNVDMKLANSFGILKKKKRKKNEE